MVESRDAQSAPHNPHQDALSADVLYRQGMAYYRRHQWQQARESFQGLKRVDPAFREVDALLDELEIFIRLESCTSTNPPQGAAPTVSTPSAQPYYRPALSVRAVWQRSTWLAPAVASAVVLLFLVYGAVNPPVSRRVAGLQERGRAHLARQEWSEAINAYEELLLLSPDNSEARGNLALAYYRRGSLRAGEAEGYEMRQRYREAAQQWEMALADFRAAHDVAPHFSPGSSDDPLDRAAIAEERRYCAGLLNRATQLAAERRWSEAAQVLLTLRSEEPNYLAADVQAYLSRTCLEAGLAGIAAADSVPRIREGLDLLRQARDAQPASVLAATALQRAQVYLQAAVSCEARDWGGAIAALESLLQQDPGYAGGGARMLLCRAYMQRAGDLYSAGKLQPALADYRAVWAAGCAQGAEARRQVTMLALALTPTARPTSLLAPTATPALIVSSELSATLPLTPATTLLLSPSP